MKTTDIIYRAFQDNEMLVQEKSGVYGLKRFMNKLYEDTDLMVFTGMFDATKRPIFEGDILHVDGTKEYARCIAAPKENEYVARFHVELGMTSWGWDFDWSHVVGYDCSTHIMGNADDNNVLENVTIIGNSRQHQYLLTI